MKIGYILEEPNITWLELLFNGIGIIYWSRAVQQAGRLQGEFGSSLLPDVLWGRRINPSNPRKSLKYNPNSNVKFSKHKGPNKNLLGVSILVARTSSAIWCNNSGSHELTKVRVRWEEQKVNIFSSTRTSS